MDVIRFALGFRFDAFEGGDDAAARDAALSLLFSRLDPRLFAGMKFFGGHYKLDENDDERIFTIVTTGQGLTKTRKLYKAIKNDPFIMSALTDRRPIIQTNVIFHIEGFDYYGECDEQGQLQSGDMECNIEIAPENGAFSKCYPLKIVIAPDKFKGSFSQFEVIDIIKQAARRILPGCRLIAAPAADGGDGTAEVLARLLNGRRKKLTVTGPDWEKVEAEYCFIGDRTAVIEMAACSGLALVRNKPDPLDATSRGTGEIIADALKNGANKLLIAIGGSATNDGGVGAAVALGAKFTDEVGNEFEGCASNMEFIRNIDVSGLDPLIKEAEITVLCDVNNPMTGENGATMVFGPQKGASKEQLVDLERGMKNLEYRYDGIAGREICSQPGAGAAGGMGAMLMALANAKAVNGAETVLDTMGFDKLIRGADVVITGEGCFDGTSIRSGKATGEVIRRAAQAGALPVIIAGCLGEGWESVYEVSPEACVFSTVTEPSERSALMETDAERLKKAAERAFRTLRSCMGRNLNG